MSSTLTPEELNALLGGKAKKVTKKSSRKASKKASRKASKKSLKGGKRSRKGSKKASKTSKKSKKSKKSQKGGKRALNPIMKKMLDIKKVMNSKVGLHAGKDFKIGTDAKVLKSIYEKYGYVTGGDKDKNMEALKSAEKDVKDMSKDDLMKLYKKFM